ncbi:MAG: hypothetical protein Q8R67_12200 [Rhodoferax sp.]|nr:hypothetical protein [Rhodoferax sp.]MDP3652434.1 hypothetical protein [Rhodoferax sp.]
MLKTFSVRITLSDGMVHVREVTASSALDLFDQMQSLTKEYPNYVRSEGSLIRQERLQ